MVGAQGDDMTNSELGQFIGSVQVFINSRLIPLVFALALLFFLYGVFKYFIAGSDNETSRAEGKKYIMYALIGFVVMVSIWGIVALLASVIPGAGPIDLPTI